MNLNSESVIEPL